MSESAHDAGVRVVPLGGGRYLSVTGGRQQLAYAARAGHVVWVFIDGVVHVIDRTPSRRRAARTDDEAALTAPMPATVLRVSVAEGQRVARGDVLLVLEAMKIELPVKAPRDGVVKALACRPGELVQPGVPLLEIE